MLKSIFRTLKYLIWTIVSVYALCVLLLHIPAVQEFMGEKVANILSQKIGSKVCIGKINLGFLNKIVIDDVEIYDQDNEKMIRLARLSTRVNLKSLEAKQLSLGSLRIFGFNGSFYRNTPESKPNYQFLLDSLASKDTLSEKTFLSYSIKDIIIRHGKIRYDVKSIKQKDEQFDANHLNISNLSSHMKLRYISEDSVNVSIKKLSLTEQSGFEIKQFKGDFNIGGNSAKITNFALQLPHTSVTSNELYASCPNRKWTKDMADIKASGKIYGKVSTSDIAPLLPTLKGVESVIEYDIATNVANNNITSAIKAKVDDNHTEIIGDIKVQDYIGTKKWNARFSKLHISSNGLSKIDKLLSNNKINIPKEIKNLDNISYTGNVEGRGFNLSKPSDNIGINGELATGAGNITISGNIDGNGDFQTSLLSDDINIGQITQNKNLGNIDLNVDAVGHLKNDKLSDLKVNGKINSLSVNGYTYKDIDIEGLYEQDVANINVAINDPNVKGSVSGNVKTKKSIEIADFTADIQEISPYSLGIIKRSNKTSTEALEYIRDAHINYGSENGQKYLSFNSDFLQLDVNGQFNYSTILQSMTNIMASRIPTMPGLSRVKNVEDNDFTLTATINKTEWLSLFTDIPLKNRKPITIDGVISDRDRSFFLKAKADDIEYGGNNYRNINIDINTNTDTLMVEAEIDRPNDNGTILSAKLLSDIVDNSIISRLSWTNNDKGSDKIEGNLNCNTTFVKTAEGKTAVDVSLSPSEVIHRDSLWVIHPSEIIYTKNNLEVKNFKISHGDQHIYASGKATKSVEDKIDVDLNQVNVSYIMDLVNFHSVKFDGLATGKATVSSVFAAPQLSADIQVDKFQFQEGNMGTLYAHAEYNPSDEQINISAHADESLTSQTLIHGYVSPRRNYMDLSIDAKGTNAEFLHSFCKSFMDYIDADIFGSVNLVGPLNRLQLVGQVEVSGDVKIKPLGTTYTLKRDTITLTEDDMHIENQAFYDKFGSAGLITGDVFHKHLTKISYDLGFQAENLLCYNFDDFGDGVICGTIYADGTASIKQKYGGDIIIDIEATPRKNTLFAYDASNNSTSTQNGYLRWNISKDTLNGTPPTHNEADMPSNLYMNMLINCNQDASIKVLMDKSTNDHIILNGDGVIRGAYYNKGALDLFGTYSVDHGIYKLTIQNIIKKDFTFQPNGSIIFGGEPYNADLNLKALYTVNGVSLSDLDASSNFSRSTIRVNCLMNIGGKVKQPVVNFDLELPTVNSDEQQMVKSIINSREDMNQQVIYLLALGRFYTSGVNNSSSVTGSSNSEYSQTTRTMQSIFSGALSSQINNVLSSVVNDNNWNFGANIITGTEGWKNAEYEGLVTGRMLNNRLLINGQFGYKDSQVKDNQTFIGDFDIKYLLTPSGSLALKVYNQTNDRYFTKSTLNTQGIGLIIKKDFTKFKDLFKRKNKKKKQSKKEEKR